MAGLLPPIFVELKANASEFHAEMGKARAEMTKLETSGSASFQKLAAVGKVALMGIATAAVTVGTEAVHMADKFELSHVRLQTAIKNTGGNFDAYKGQVSAVDKKLEGLGFTNAQTEMALGTLTTGTGSAKKALAEMGTAADLARFKNLDLNDAAFMLTRALQGNSRVLKQLGIDLPTTVASASQLKKMQEAVTVETEKYNLALEKFHGKSKTTQADLDALKIAHDHLVYSTKQLSEAQHTGDTIQAAVDSRLHGQSAAYAQTFAGKLDTLRARTEDLGKNIGEWLTPKIEAMVSATTSAVTWLTKHKAIVQDLAAVIGTALTAAISAYIVKLGQSVVATTVGVGKQIVSWTGFKTAVVTDGTEIAAASAAAATETSTAWTLAFGSAATSAAEFATAADAAFLEVVGAAGVAGGEAAVSFRTALLGGLGGLALLGVGGIPDAIKVPKSGTDIASSIAAAQAANPGVKYGYNGNGKIVPVGSLPIPTHRTDLTDLAAGYAGTSTHRTDYADLAAAYAPTPKKKPPVVPPVPTGTWDNTPGAKGPKPPKPLTPAQIAALKFQTVLTNLGSKISSQSNLNPGSLGMAKVYEKAENATLREAEAAKKHAAALVKAAHGAKAKEAATKVLATAQADVNRATKNLLAIKKDEQTLIDAQRQAALDAAQAAAALANAKIEAGLDFSNAAAVAQAKVTEAQNTLGADQAGSLQYYQDLAALHQAQVDLTNVLAQNTQATIANTVAMTQPLNQLPTYLADRAAVNAGAYAGSRGSGAGTHVTIQGGTFIGTNLDKAAQDIASALNALSRRNGRGPVF